MIASVIYNRLAQKMPLGLDSTIKYIAPDSKGAFVTAEEKAIKSPYNTYINTGLPPGPIASPGEASIEAALNARGHGLPVLRDGQPRHGRDQVRERLPGAPQERQGTQRMVQGERLTLA